MPDRHENNPGNPLDFAYLHREAAGIIRLHLIPPSLGRRIFEAAAHGDGHAFALACGLAKSLGRIRTAPSDQRMLCMCCPTELCTDHALTLILATGHVDQPSIGMGAALCTRCGSRPDRHERVTDALRKVWPDLRPVTIHTEAGHA